jgi:uridine kinase
MRPLIIGIAGGSGSGKSTVAQRIATSLGGTRVAFLDMDAYYRNFPDLAFEDRRKLNFDHPDAFDLELLAEHLGRLAAGQAIEKPAYDFVQHLRKPTKERVEPAEVIVVDGILLLVDERIRAHCDVKVFVDIDADTRLIRRIRRDMVVRGRPLEEILDQYQNTVQPMHVQFVEPSKRYADLIIPRGGENAVAIDLLVNSVARRLAGGGP